MKITVQVTIRGCPPLPLEIDAESLIGELRQQIVNTTGLKPADIARIYCANAEPAGGHDLDDYSIIGAVGIRDGTTVNVDIKSVDTAPQGSEARIDKMVQLLAAAAPPGEARSFSPATLSTIDISLGPLTPPIKLPRMDTSKKSLKSSTWSITNRDERRRNWNGEMLTQAEFVARYGTTDGVGLFEQSGHRESQVFNIRRLPTDVAVDIAEFLKYAEANGGMTAQRRAIVRQILEPLEKQKNKLLVDKDIIESPGFQERMQKNLTDFIDGRKALNAERKEKVKQSPWRLALHNFLTNWRVELVLTILLILDIIFVIVSINLEVAALDAEVKDCEHYAEQVHHQCRAADSHCTSHRFLRAATTCSCSDVPEFGNEEVEKAEHGVRWTSVSILAVFVLDGLLHLLEMGTRFFTENNGVHFIDLIVVSVALTFEAFPFDNWSNAFVFLIIGRLWRFVQFWHSMKHAENQPVVDMSFHVLEHIPEILIEAMENPDNEKTTLGEPDEMIRVSIT